MRPRALAGALLLLHAAVAVAQVHEGERIVTARLVADTVRVQPGQPFTAGVHLSIAPGWHVYWENPGDTALPIAIDWRLPDGAAASPLRWPRPERYQETGGVTVFGYEGEALLLTTVSPPASIPGGSFRLEARAEWLVCEELCIPGDALVTLALPVGEPAPSGDVAAIRRFAASVPASGADEGVRIVSARARRDADAWSFRLEVDAGGRRIVDFFPRAIEGFLIDHGGIEVRGRAIELSALPDEPDLVPGRIGGVVVTDRGSFDVAAAVSDGDPDVVAGESPPGAPGASVSPPPASDPPPPAETGASTPAPAADPSASSPEAAASSVDPAVGTDWLARDFANTAESRSMSLATLLLFAMLGGLLLNVMPCVLPVISLKVLSFVHQSGQDRGRARVLGLMFAAGVIASFWVLVAAVVAIRATAAEIGWGFQFQSPIFVLLMSAVVLVFAMNLFGVFEIRGFSFGGPAGAQGPGGAFVHGALATALATPCTAPFLGTAIGFAFTQSTGVLFLAFTAAAIGLALPYVLLAWHPEWLRWLPRPGAWMVRFKQAMGFVLIATVVWLLSVLGAQLGPDGVTWSLVFLTFVAFAVWLAGQAGPSTGAVPRAVILLVAAALVFGGYVWALETELRWREPVELRAEPRSHGGIEWKEFSLSDLERRVERGETVFVDFTADWCWNCKVNERTVLASSSVEQRFRELDVTAVKADWTRRNPEITRLLAKFGRVGVPFYAVFPAGRLTQPIPLSEVITPASVLEALERAGPSRLQTQK